MNESGGSTAVADNRAGELISLDVYADWWFCRRLSMSLQTGQSGVQDGHQGALSHSGRPERNALTRAKAPQFSWTLIRGESNVQGGGGNGSIEERAGEGVGGDGGSPEGDRSARRRRGREAGPLAPGQRWSVGRKRDVVLRLLRGESLAALSREVGVEIYRLEDWRDRAVAGLERGLQARQGDLVAEALDAATRHIGELSMENELLRERARAAEQRRP